MNDLKLGTWAVCLPGQLEIKVMSDPRMQDVTLHDDFTTMQNTQQIQRGAISL